MAYQTAYLKAHYPTEFMAAVLSSEMDGAERDKFFVEHIDDCRRMGIEVLPPEREPGGRVVPGRPARGRSTSAWGRSRGSGSRPSRRSSRRESRGGRSRSLDDFFERVSTREVGSGCAETLIRAGAFDCLGSPPSRSSWPILPRAIQAGQAKQEDRRRGQRGLFDDLGCRRRLRSPNGNGNGHANGTGSTCPTSPSCPTPSGSAARRRRSASTCRATR